MSWFFMSSLLVNERGKKRGVIKLSFIWRKCHNWRERLTGGLDETDMPGHRVTQKFDFRPNSVVFVCERERRN